MKGFGLIGDLQCYLPHQSHLSAGVKFLSMHQIDLSILNGIGVVSKDVREKNKSKKTDEHFMYNYDNK